MCIKLGQIGLGFDKKAQGQTKVILYEHSALQSGLLPSFLPNGNDLDDDYLLLSTLANMVCSSSSPQCCDKWPATQRTSRGERALAADKNANHGISNMGGRKEGRKAASSLQTQTLKAVARQLQRCHVEAKTAFKSYYSTLGDRTSIAKFGFQIPMQIELGESHWDGKS